MVSVGTLIRFVRWMIQVDPPRVMAQAAVEAALALALAAQVWVVRGLVDHAVAVYRLGLPPAQLLPWLAVWAALGLCNRVLDPLVRVLGDRLREEMEDAVRQRLQAKAARLRLEVFDRPDFGDLMRRAEHAASPVQFRARVARLAHAPHVVFAAVALAAVVAAWSPLLLAATIVAAIPALLADTQRTRALQILRRSLGADERLRGYLVNLLTSRPAAAEVRAFDLGPWLGGWWERVDRRLMLAGGRTWKRGALQRAALHTVRLAGLGAAVVWVGWEVAAGRLSPGTLAAALVAFGELHGHVATLGRVGRLFAGDGAPLGDLFAFLDLGPEEPGGGAPVARIGDLQARNVAFRYPAGTAALADISLQFGAGERVALVGANGSGKTTLVKVLTGLYQPTQGQVRYGGRDLARLDLTGVRRRTAALFQDHVRYAFTLRENIGFGRVERVDDMVSVREAARRGGADEVAAVLPDGFATVLGRVFEGGTDLSGGQWQRVSASRALMRQAELLVLDEPAAALDPLAEAEAYRRHLDAARDEGVTALLVTHRLGAARRCDRILVLRDGRLVEQGQHDDLLAAGGEYASMWAAQAQWYR